MKYLFLIAAFSINFSFAYGSEFLSPGSLVSMECSNASEGTVIKYIKENNICPETSYRCNPIMEVKNGNSISFNPENVTSHLIEFQGPNDVQTRYKESALGTMYGNIWAWGSRASNSSFWFFVDMKSCLINRASENVNVSTNIKCSFILKEDGYYSFQFFKNGGWNGVSASYGISPCIKIQKTLQ
jgi:hypothetical protein